MLAGSHPRISARSCTEFRRLLRASVRLMDRAVVLGARLLLGHLVGVRVRYGGQSIRFAKPTSQIDCAAPLAAKRQGGRCCRVELTITNRTSHRGNTSMMNDE